MATALTYKLGKTPSIIEGERGITCLSHDPKKFYADKFVAEVVLTTQFPIQASWPPVITSFTHELLDLTNAHRYSMGLQLLALHPVLQGISDWKCANCANYLYMDHNTPAEDDWGLPARTIMARFNDLGYPINMAWGENLAYGFLTAQSVFDAWMSDIGHRQNIEGRDYTTCGMSAVKATKMDDIFFGQDFGTYAVVPFPPVDPYTHTIWKQKVKGFKIQINSYDDTQKRVWYSRLDNHKSGNMLVGALKRNYTKVV